MTASKLIWLRVSVLQQCKLRLLQSMMRHKWTKSRFPFRLNWLQPLSFHSQLFNAFSEQPRQSCSMGRPLMKCFQMASLSMPCNALINPPFKSKIRELAKPCPKHHPHHPILNTSLRGPLYNPCQIPNRIHFSSPVLSMFNEVVIYLWPAKSCSNPTPDNNGSVTVFLKHAA